MKTLLVVKSFVLLILLAFAFSSKAQNYSLASSTGFNVESGTITGETLNVNGESWDIYETLSESKYVKATSASGKTYPIWIGQLSGDIFQYNGEVYPVRYSKSGTPFILVIGEQKNLYTKYLKKE